MPSQIAMAQADLVETRNSDNSHHGGGGAVSLTLSIANVVFAGREVDGWVMIDSGLSACRPPCFRGGV
jgi:hypothetical protein